MTPEEPVEPREPAEPEEPIGPEDPMEPEGAAGVAGRDKAGAPDTPEGVFAVPGAGNWRAGGTSAGIGAAGYRKAAGVEAAVEEAGWGALISVDQSRMGWDIRCVLGMMDTSQVL